jgi:hypothetical protein
MCCGDSIGAARPKKQHAQQSCAKREPFPAVVAVPQRATRFGAFTPATEYFFTN